MKKFSKKIIKGISNQSGSRKLSFLTLDICESPDMEDTLVQGKCPSLLCKGKTLEGDKFNFFIKYSPLLLTYQRAKERLEDFATEVWAHYFSRNTNTQVTYSGKFIFHGDSLNSTPK